jgi:hypothetical protein
VHRVRPDGQLAPTAYGKKFFASFFQKRSAFLLFLKAGLHGIWAVTFSSKNQAVFFFLARLPFTRSPHG